MERRRGIGMLGWRRGTPRWADDTVQRHNRKCRWTGKKANSPSEGSLTTGGSDRGGRE